LQGKRFPDYFPIHDVPYVSQHHYCGSLISILSISSRLPFFFLKVLQTFLRYIPVILHGSAFCTFRFNLASIRPVAFTFYAGRKKDCFRQVGVFCVCVSLERKTHHLQPSLVDARKAKSGRRAISSSSGWFLSQEGVSDLSCR